MLATTEASLIPSLAVYLSDAQAIVNGAGTYREKIELANSRWQALNRNTNARFMQIRDLLSSLHGDLQRCAYCEDSLGHQIEHVFPKVLFPSVVFSWDNFLHACGSCNGTKLAKFSVFGPGGVVIELKNRQPPDNEPLGTHPLLINPRVENPLDFLILDLYETFHFVPTGHCADRANYTIETLQLNHRAGLVAARKTALALYRSSIIEYEKEKSGAANLSTLKKIAKRISCEMPHRTVWEEIKRQQARAPWLIDFRNFFLVHPEAVGW